jgi:hypothetical protein
MTTRHAVAIIGLTWTGLLGALAPVDSTAGEKSRFGSWIVEVMLSQPGPAACVVAPVSTSVARR